MMMVWMGAGAVIVMAGILGLKKAMVVMDEEAENIHMADEVH